MFNGPGREDHLAILIARAGCLFRHADPAVGEAARARRTIRLQNNIWAVHGFVRSMGQSQACNCPLCGNAAQAVELAGLDIRRVECPYCTTYEISRRVERFLFENPEVKARARYVCVMARRATNGVPAEDVLERCLKLRTERNLLENAAKGEARQESD